MMQQLRISFLVLLLTHFFYSGLGFGQNIQGSRLHPVGLTRSEYRENITGSEDIPYKGFDRLIDIRREFGDFKNEEESPSGVRPEFEISLPSQDPGILDECE